HRRAALAVAAVDVLDHFFSSIPPRKIEVDVRPLAALLGEEALEEEAHADRVDRGDAERVADGAVGGRAAALAEDAALAGEADDVPDDQEVAGEVELLDHGEFVLELGADARPDRPVPLARPRMGELAEMAHRGRARGKREVGEAVAQVGERELAALRDAATPDERLRQVGHER